MSSVKTPSLAKGPFRIACQFQSPSDHLACDEALLEFCEKEEAPGFLRFWESSDYFVVLGYGKHLEQEVLADVCAQKRIPIRRRCSGGGTVLQGPGCLNYSLVMPISSHPELESISGANRFIMERNREAVARVTRDTIVLQGHTDLTLNGRKFSGNAQRRKRRCLLFHGAFLLNFDLALISQTLKAPPQQPEYRAGREHGEFVRNLAVGREVLIAGLSDAWNAREECDEKTVTEIRMLTEELVRSKYGLEEWNYRS